MKRSTFDLLLGRLVADTVCHLEKVLSEGRSKDVHNFRTSLRRLQAAFAIHRGGDDSGEYYLQLRSLSRKTAALRDTDVVIARLKRLDRELTASTRRELDEARRKNLKRVRRVLRNFLSEYGDFHPEGVNGKTLTREYSSLVASLEKRMERMMPAVSRPGADPAEMHRFRRTGRRLRYLVELGGEEEVAKLLKRLQQLLGEVRDIELTQPHLNGRRFSDLRERELSRRDALLKQFWNDWIPSWNGLSKSKD